MDKIKMSQNGEFLLDYDNLYCLVMDWEKHNKHPIKIVIGNNEIEIKNEKF
jgi:hypothetical protein